LLKVGEGERVKRFGLRLPGFFQDNSGEVSD